MATIFRPGTIQSIVLNALIGVILSGGAVGMFIGASRTSNPGSAVLAVLGVILFFIGGYFLFYRTGDAISDYRYLRAQAKLAP